MKALKLILISALLVLVTNGIVHADGSNNNNQVKANQKVIHLDFEDIYRVPGLEQAMRRQLDGSFLVNSQPNYTIDVNYSRAIFRITGTYEQWLNFFWPKWLNPNPVGVKRSESRIK